MVYNIKVIVLVGIYLFNLKPVSDIMDHPVYINT